MSEIGQDATPQVVDRKELLAQQFDAVEQAATVQTDKPAAAAPVTTAADRARDEAGKFTKKVDEDRFSPTFGKEVKTPVADPAAQAVQAAPVLEPKPWDGAPKSWKKDKRVLWEAMTPEQREYAFQREEEMKASYDAAAPKADMGDKVLKAAEPYMNTIRGLGMELPQAVAGLMKVDHDLRTLPYEQKLAVLTNIARGYGIDLTGQAQAATPGFDPNYQQLQNELLSVKGQMSNWERQQEASAQAAAQQEIERFAKTAEYFDEVKPTMAKLLQGGLAESVTDAYEKAISLHPEINSAINSAKQAAADVEKRAAANAAAQRAKAAAVSVKSATPGVTKQTNAQDRRSMLREQLDGLSERL